MEYNKTYKIIAVIALILGVVGVTLGYAAFSSTLKIESSAEVVPNGSNFNVDFSSSSSSVVANDITPQLSANATGFSATDATINNSSDPVISNLHATFTEPGQSVTYTFYAYNAGQYLAYLNSIVFTGSKTCTARSNTNQGLVDIACTGISLSVSVANATDTINATTTSIASITGHSIAIGAADTVTVVITYASGSGRADGDFDVTLPDITLTYNPID